MLGANALGAVPLASVQNNGTIPDPPTSTPGTPGDGWGHWVRWGRPFKWLHWHVPPAP